VFFRFNKKDRDGCQPADLNCQRHEGKKSFCFYQRYDFCSGSGCDHCFWVVSKALIAASKLDSALCEISPLSRYVYVPKFLLQSIMIYRYQPSRMLPYDGIYGKLFTRQLKLEIRLHIVFWDA
jgi:hypothetical protein